MALDKDTIDFFTKQNDLQTKAITTHINGVKKALDVRLDSIEKQNEVRNSRLENAEDDIDRNKQALFAVAQNCKEVQMEKPHDYISWKWLKQRRWWIAVVFVLSVLLISLIGHEINWRGTADKQAEKRGIELTEPFNKNKGP